MQLMYIDPEYIRKRIIQFEPDNTINWQLFAALYNELYLNHIPGEGVFSGHNARSLGNFLIFQDEKTQRLLIIALESFTLDGNLEWLMGNFHIYKHWERRIGLSCDGFCILINLLEIQGFQRYHWMIPILQLFKRYELYTTRQHYKREKELELEKIKK